jgi:hypothetical protein
MTSFEKSELKANTFSSPRQKTFYLEAGPIDGPLIFFVHGWPEIGLMWRFQMEFLLNKVGTVLHPICVGMVVQEFRLTRVGARHG